MKAKEKPNTLKDETEAMNEKSAVLSEEDLLQVSGAGDFRSPIANGAELGDNADFAHHNIITKDDSEFG